MMVVKEQITLGLGGSSSHLNGQSGQMPTKGEKVGGYGGEMGLGGHSEVPPSEQK